VPAVSGDRDRLIQVMVNLLSNAVKFCNPDRGMIVVRLRSFTVDPAQRIRLLSSSIAWENRGKWFRLYGYKQKKLYASS
jgi:signal transduction histidine kinase